MHDDVQTVLLALGIAMYLAKTVFELVKKSSNRDTSGANVAVETVKAELQKERLHTIELQLERMNTRLDRIETVLRKDI